MNFIAKLGQNIQFVAFCAHMFAAAWLVAVLPYKWPTVVLVLLFGAIKEFWFDAKYENDQTLEDNVQDFLGYALGVLLGLAS